MIEYLTLSILPGCMMVAALWLMVKLRFRSPGISLLAGSIIVRGVFHEAHMWRSNNFAAPFSTVLMWLVAYAHVQLNTSPKLFAVSVGVMAGGISLVAGDAKHPYRAALQVCAAGMLVAYFLIAWFLRLSKPVARRVWLLIYICGAVISSRLPAAIGHYWWDTTLYSELVQLLALAGLIRCAYVTFVPDPAGTSPSSNPAIHSQWTRARRASPSA